jgi:hypothetical protein
LIALGYGAFWNCRSLTRIVLPGGLTAIEDGTFFGCGELTEVVIPDSVTAIGKRAFDSCDSLTRVVIPEGVTTLEEEAFRGCWGLTHVTLPDSLTFLGKDAFEPRDGLRIRVTNLSVLPPKLKRCALLSFAEENTVYTVSLTEHPAIARALSVRSVPTVLLFEDGMEKGRRIGAFNRQHLQRLQDGVPLGRL